LTSDIANDPNTPQAVKDFLSGPSNLTGENAQSFANSIKLRGQKKRAELEVTIPGDPSLTCRKLITVEGLAKRDSGNWYISECKHTIDDSEGYHCELGLNRSGSGLKRGAGKSNTNVNTKKASSDDASDTKVKHVDVSAQTGDTQVSAE
jgi:hypothetical protein